MDSSKEEKNQQKKILVVEDEVIVGSDIKQVLEYRGYQVPEIISSGEEALEKIKEIKPDLVLLDIKLAGKMDGIETAQRIRSQNDIPIVYLTALGDDKTFQRAKQTDPFGYIYKPAEEKDLIATVETALYKHSIQKKLLESEKKFRNLFEMSKEAIYISSIDPKIEDTNPAFLEMFGYSSDEIKKIDERELYHDPKDRLRIKNSIESRGFIKDFPLKMKTKQGSFLDCLVTATCRKDTSDNLSGYQGIIRDVTEEKRMQKKLKESEKKYRDLFEYSNDAVFLMSPEGEQVDFNRKAAELVGYSEEELKGIPFTELIAESERKDAQSKLEEIKRKKTIPVYRRTVKKKDGTKLQVEINLSLISDSEGNPFLIQSIVRDISEQRS